MGVGRPIEELDLFSVRRNHIIGIGINEYKHGSTIDSCRLDIERFTDVMLKYYHGFDEQWVTKIFSKPEKQPTKTYILDLIRNKIRFLNNEDNVIIYLSGHGISDENMFYFAIYNSDKKNYNTFISLQEIINILNRQNVRHFLLIIDACYSGKALNIYRNFCDSKLEEDASFWKRVYAQKSVWVLTSGDIEVVEKKSPFLETMLKIFESFAKNQKALIISDLRNEILRYIGKYTQQTPQIGKLNNVEGYEKHGGEFVFIPNTIKEEEPELIIPKKPEKEGPKQQLNIPIEPVTPPVDTPVVTPVVEDTSVVDTKIDSHQTLNPKSEIEEKKSHFKHILAGALFFIIISIAYYIGDRRYQKIISEKDPTTLVDDPQPTNPPPDTSKPEPPTEPVIPKPPKKPMRHKPKPTNEDFNPSLASNNLVFVGSFNEKSNAEAILERLKTVGYENAEIIMKENMPYAVVVSGFYSFKSSAKAEVRALKKRGFEVYYSNIDSIGIYRRK